MLKLGSTITVLALGAASLAACVDADESIDDTAAADGKADGYTDSSREALAVYRLLNTVGLNSLQSIVGDDSSFWQSFRDNVAEARALGGYNTVGFGLRGLANAGGIEPWLNWAKDVGYLPASGDASNPFSSASCAGPRLNGNDLVGWIAPGEVEAAFGNYEVFVRRRICSGTGCGPWETNRQVATGTARVRMEVTDPRLVLIDAKTCMTDPTTAPLPWRNTYRLADGAAAWSNGDLIALPGYSTSVLNASGSCSGAALRPGLSGDARDGFVRFLGGVTDTCFRFVSRPMRVSRDATTQWEEQYVLLGSHD
jgi:hypothetical protein